MCAASLLQANGSFRVTRHFPVLCLTISKHGCGVPISAACHIDMPLLQMAVPMQHNCHTVDSGVLFPFRCFLEAVNPKSKGQDLDHGCWRRCVETSPWHVLSWDMCMHVFNQCAKASRPTVCTAVLGCSICSGQNLPYYSHMSNRAAASLLKHRALPALEQPAHCRNGCLCLSGQHELTGTTLYICRSVCDLCRHSG